MDLLKDGVLINAYQEINLNQVVKWEKIIVFLIIGFFQEKNAHLLDLNMIHLNLFKL